MRLDQGRHVTSPLTWWYKVTNQMMKLFPNHLEVLESMHSSECVCVCVSVLLHTFKEDEPAVMSLIGSTDVSRQTPPEVTTASSTCVSEVPWTVISKNKFPHNSLSRPCEIRKLFFFLFFFYNFHICYTAFIMGISFLISYSQKAAFFPLLSVTTYLKMSFLPHSVSHLAPVIWLDNFNYSFPDILLVLFWLEVPAAHSDSVCFESQRVKHLHELKETDK